MLSEFNFLKDGATVVGHSVGATILLHTLADERPTITPAAIVLIAAPFIGKGGWPSDDVDERANLPDRLPKGVPVLLYHGMDDQTVPVEHVQLYAKAIPQAIVRTLVHRDHQLNDDLREVANDVRSLPTFRRR